MWNWILFAAYLAALVTIWRGWGWPGRILSYVGLHVLALPGWLLLGAAILDDREPVIERNARIYVLVVMAVAIAVSSFARDHKMKRQERYDRAVLSMAGYPDPGAYAGDFGPNSQYPNGHYENSQYPRGQYAGDQHVGNQHGPGHNQPSQTPSPSQPPAPSQLPRPSQPPAE
ncbi:hypothetical protein GCG21_08735 [Pseudactinotalea sp. HY160]|uniref:hypothetical protein n=1 Tax=Pseudactinotalea sp. HY160 TaxID=2654490 RepID=UPI00128C823E|nr:hypothetical protein [Pseudactinotalea sp. HY160]MPV50090.1 hypothetical protein [Pseudactinotalea sp. HY160]